MIKNSEKSFGNCFNIPVEVEWISNITLKLTYFFHFRPSLTSLIIYYFYFFTIFFYYVNFRKTLN